MKRSDAELYRRMQEPKASAAQTTEDINNFYEEVYALREKFGIPDVHVIVAGGYMTADGDDESAYIADFHAGDDMLVEKMVAWSLGKATKERQERIGRLVSDAVLMVAGKKP